MFRTQYYLLQSTTGQNFQVFSIYTLLHPFTLPQFHRHPPTPLFLIVVTIIRHYRDPPRGY